MANGRFVSYLRVSTPKQGQSGLGLEAQRKAVTDYLNGGNWEVLADFVEIESGKDRERPELKKALDRCKLTGATLLVAKIDRLARDAAFLLSLRDAGVDFLAADMPDANRMTVGIMAIIAEHERDAISARTKAALAAAKARGVRLGKPENLTPANAERGRVLGRVANKARVDARSADLAPIVRDIIGTGRTTLASIADGLNERHIPASRGGSWSATQVGRLLDRLAMRRNGTDVRAPN